MIKFNNVTKIYSAGEAILQNISFEVEEGEFVSIVGKSGVGKTTLTRLILGLEPPTSGEVYFKGMNINDMDSVKIQEMRRKIGCIYQDYKLLPKKTVYENVAYIMQVEGKENEEIAKEVPKVLEIIGLGGKINNFPDQLSGGEKQRLAIARALVNQPDIIIADEPTGNLDSRSGEHVMDILKKLHKEEKRTIIVVTHDEKMALYATKKMVIEDGKITNMFVKRTKTNS